MIKNNHWLLPEGVDELLPRQAELVDDVRTKVIQKYKLWGYRLVMTPMVEFESAMLSGGEDVHSQAFRTTDVISGRQLCFRPDITPQVARIDAHSERHQSVARYCYAGTVLHASTRDLAGSRCSLQVGAELYGSASTEADCEIAELMLETVATVVGDRPLYLDIGHVALYRCIVEASSLTSEQEAAIFSVVQSKATHELEELIRELKITDESAKGLRTLTRLNGGIEVIQDARSHFGQLSPAMTDALDELEMFANQLGQRFPDLTLHVDLAHLRGYRYHTGLIFGVFTPSVGRPLASGGRYDDVGRHFGRERPATGFSADLRFLTTLGVANANVQGGILAPVSAKDELKAKVDALRADGERVIWMFEDNDDLSGIEADRKLVKTDNGWQVVAL